MLFSMYNLLSILCALIVIRLGNGQGEKKKDFRKGVREPEKGVAYKQKNNKMRGGLTHCTVSRRGTAPCTLFSDGSTIMALSNYMHAPRLRLRAMERLRKNYIVEMKLRKKRGESQHKMNKMGK